MMIGLICVLIFNAFCLIRSAYLAAAFLRPKNSAEVVMAVFLTSWAQINVLMHMLGACGTLGSTALSVAHGAVWLSCEAVRRWSRFPTPKWFDGAEWKGVWHSWQVPKFIRWGMMTWFVLILIGTLYLALAVPQNHGDSLAYHLSRAAHWLQNQSLAHYETELYRQNEMPITAELGILWTFVMVRSDLLAGLTQWLCWVPMALACYGIPRALRFSTTVSIFTTFTLLTLPQVVYQSSSTQNDLLGATFLLCGLYFMLQGFPGCADRAETHVTKPRYRGALVLSATGIGLALGTKGYILLWGPGVLMILLFIVIRSPLAGRWIQAARFSVGVAGFAVLFNGFTWLENWRWYGNPLLSSHETKHQRVTDPDGMTLASVSLKNWAWFCEPMRVGEIVFGKEQLQNQIMRFLRQQHEALGLDLSSPRTTIGHDNKRFKLPETPRNRITAHLGPIGFVFLWPAMALALICGLVRCTRPDRLSSPAVNAAVWVLAALSYFLLMSYLLCWQRAGGRLMISFSAAALPSVAFVYASAGALHRLAGWGLGLAVGFFALGASAEALLQNPRAPFLATAEEGSILGKSRGQLRFEMLNRDESLLPSLVVESLVPATARMGLALDPRASDFPLFGPRLERRCIPLIRSKVRQAGLTATMDALQLDALLMVNDADREERDLPPALRIPLTRRVTAEGITLFEWKDCFLAIREPLPVEAYPGIIRSAAE